MHDARTVYRTASLNTDRQENQFIYLFIRDNGGGPLMIR